TASWPFRISSPSFGIISPFLAKYSQFQGNMHHSSLKPNLSPATSRTRMPSGTTSFPIPSPMMTAILCVDDIDMDALLPYDLIPARPSGLLQKLQAERPVEDVPCLSAILPSRCVMSIKLSPGRSRGRYLCVCM